jgi:chromosome segregation ATPase
MAAVALTLLVIAGGGFETWRWREQHRKEEADKAAAAVELNKRAEQLQAAQVARREAEERLTKAADDLSKAANDLEKAKNAATTAASTTILVRREAENRLVTARSNLKKARDDAEEKLRAERALNAKVVEAIADSAIALRQALAQKQRDFDDSAAALATARNEIEKLSESFSDCKHVRDEATAKLTQAQGEISDLQAGAISPGGGRTARNAKTAGHAGKSTTPGGAGLPNAS